MSYKVFEVGDRVHTPGGVGKVVYKRMLAPTFEEVATYSVLLDDKVAASNLPPFPSYTGTVYPASLVREESFGSWMTRIVRDAI